MHRLAQILRQEERSPFSYLQYNRIIPGVKATAYVKQIEDLGFIGPQKGAAAREIITSWDHWSESLKGNGVGWDEEDDLWHHPVELRQSSRNGAGCPAVWRMGAG